VAAATSLEQEVPQAQRQRAAQLARCQTSLALAYARSGQAPPALVLMRGCSGSGKSQLARQLAPWLLADHLQSDRIRKGLYGLFPLARVSGPARDQLYGPAANQRTEAALLADACASLKRGRTVLLDATHLTRASRARAIELAISLGCPWLILDLQTPQSLIEARLEQRSLRNDDPSDADAAVQAVQRLSIEALVPEEAARTLALGPEWSMEQAGEQIDAPGLLMELWSVLAEPSDTPLLRPSGAH
jgi:predicted kinase